MTAVEMQTHHARTLRSVLGERTDRGSQTGEINTSISIKYVYIHSETRTLKYYE